MIRAIFLFSGLGIALVLGGCTGSELPGGQAAYQAVPALKADAPIKDYLIGPLDTISVYVFKDPDLSLKDVQVDASGNILLPLIGRVQTAGKTAGEVSDEIAKRLGDRYLENPQVTVTVEIAVSQKVTVEGSVMQPGVYDIKGPTSLLEAVALAKGTTRTAALSQVAVFRIVNGQRVGGVFNLSDIRRGAALDPEIEGNDVVVVGFSSVKSGWRDVLSAVPFLAIFKPFG